MSIFLHYWGSNVAVGWEFGGGIFEKIEFVTIFISAGLLGWKKSKAFHHKNWNGIEEFIMKWAFHICWISFVISTVFVAPFIQHKDTGELTLKVNSLTDQKDDLQKSLDKDETVIKAVQIVTGLTNGNSSGNLDKMSFKVDELQRAFKNSSAKTIADTYFEKIDFSDSNHCWSLIENTNSNVKIMLLKMKHSPVDFSMQGWMISPSFAQPQNQILGLGHRHNIIYFSFNGDWPIKEGYFAVQYVKDEADTNLIQNVAFAGGRAYYDGIPVIFIQPEDKQ